MARPPSKWALTTKGFNNNVTVHIPSRPWNTTSGTSRNTTELTPVVRRRAADSEPNASTTMPRPSVLAR